MNWTSVLDETNPIVKEMWAFTLEHCPDAVFDIFVEWPSCYELHFYPDTLSIDPYCCLWMDGKMRILDEF